MFPSLLGIPMDSTVSREARPPEKSSSERPLGEIHSVFFAFFRTVVQIEWRHAKSRNFVKFRHFLAHFRSLRAVSRQKWRWNTQKSRYPLVKRSSEGGIPGGPGTVSRPKWRRNTPKIPIFSLSNVHLSAGFRVHPVGRYIILI